MAQVKIKKSIKNEIYGRLKKLFNLKNCFLKVSYVDGEDDSTQFHITIVIERMNLTIRSCSTVKNELLDVSTLVDDIIEDTKSSVERAIKEFVYSGKETK